MQEMERDLIAEEGEAFLAKDPELREGIERQLAESAAGTLTTVADSVVAARMAERRAVRKQSRVPE